ncbi:MAG: hypothetical protein ACK4TA_22530 [Saprospiraceae bacterium]
MNSPPFKLVLVALGFLALPILYSVEIQYFNRTLHAGKLTLIAAIIGAIIGIGLGYWLQKQATDVVGSMRIYALCTIGCTLAMPLLVSLSNRLLHFHPVQNVPVEFVESSPRYSSRFGAASSEAVQPDNYITFFYKEQELLNIHTREALFPAAERGDTVTLPIQKGLWGFEIVVQP